MSTCVPLTRRSAAVPPGTRQAVKRIFTLLLLLVGVAQGLMAAPVEGRDYKRVATSAPGTGAAKITVTEFFSWQCPHCFRFSQPFAAWSRTQPADVLVERVPVAVGRPAWELAARAYFALSAMDSTQRVDAALFDAIHVQHVKFGTPQALAAWMQARGVDSARFSTLVDSPQVEQQVKAADARALGYKLTGIPAIVVNGQYLVEMHPSRDLAPQFAIVEELVARVRRERSGQGAK